MPKRIEFNIALRADSRINPRVQGYDAGMIEGERFVAYYRKAAFSGGEPRGWVLVHYRTGYAAEQGCDSIATAIDVFVKRLRKSKRTLAQAIARANAKTINEEG